MRALRRLVSLAALLLFAAWTVANFGRVVAEEEGIIRFVLGTLFALLVFFRSKPEGAPEHRRWLIPVAGVGGALMAVTGTVFRLHQAEWLGLVFVLYACLRWAMPRRYDADIALAAFLLYWVHPLPGQIFGRMQLVMQSLSIQGAERLLHAVSVRCWADGFYLRLGQRVFGVPEACSGMRTVVTVLLCTLGVCSLFRFRWYETAALLVLGLLQVLLFNILRIAALVSWSSRMPPEWSATVLHDTLGIFLLVTILLVQAEASWWRLFSARRRVRKEGMARGELDRPDKASRLPRILQAAFRWGGIAAACLVVAGGAYVGARRSRPLHRAEMIAGIVDGLMDKDPVNAERAIAAALALKPGDGGLLTKRARLLVSQKRYADALRQYDALTLPLGAMDVVFRSWCLMALGRSDEAVEAIRSLPPAAQKAPGVAIVKAEYAARRDEVAEAAQNAVLASHSHLVIDRVRALFPYLAAREQWRAIADCGNPVPPRELAPTVIEVEANLRVRETSDAARILKQGLERWPDEPLFLGSLFKLAAGAPGGEWETLFADMLRRHVDKLDAARLATYLNYSFQLSRPDLGWRAWRRLQELDPTDPALLLAPVEFGDAWFTFRKSLLRVRSQNAFETADLRTLYLATRGMEAADGFWAAVPLADEVAAADRQAMRTKYLDLGLKELESRRAAGKLTPRLEMTVPLALGMAERYDEAHARLDELMKKYPDRASALLLQHAVFYDRQRDWQRSYETLADYGRVTPMPGLPAQLMMANAMMNLNMGVAALETVTRARQDFPGASQLDEAEVGIWAAFGYAEEALFLAATRAVPVNPRIVAQLLYDTDRLREAEEAARPLGYSFRKREAKPGQPLRAPPAELTVQPRWPEPLAPEAVAAEAAKRRAAASKAASPFVRALEEALAGWYEAAGKGPVSDPDRWDAMGRNDLERAVALHHLASLLARQRDYDRATAAARRAVDRLPTSPILRRSLVGLAKGDAAVVSDARRACPDDGDIWLASLVVRTLDEGAGDWVKEYLKAAVKGKTYPPQTLVRAGEFLLGRGAAEAARIAAEDGVARARGYVPAYVLGANTALALKDNKWALECSLQGAEEAADPAPFYDLIVKIKTAANEVDADLVSALEFMKSRFPKDSQWAERLGHVYFRERDTRRAMTVLDEAFQQNLKGMRVRSLLLAAEAARLEGNQQKAVDILEAAYGVHPNDTNVLNNLVYTLANAPGGLARARDLAPKLQALGEGSFEILDTLAVVHLRSGEPEKAKALMDRALAALDANSYSALDVRLNAAELLMKLGRFSEARERVNGVRRDPKRSDATDARARDLLARIERESAPAKSSGGAGAQTP